MFTKVLTTDIIKHYKRRLIPRDIVVFPIVVLAFLKTVIVVVLVFFKYSSISKSNSSISFSKSSSGRKSYLQTDR